MGRTSDARERLIDEASRLFHARSYESVGVQELCDAAEVNKGSFYHFFPSKEDLAAAVIDAQWEATREEIFEPSLAEDLPPLARIERLFKALSRAQRGARRESGRTPGCPLANLAGELSNHEPKLRRKLARVYGEMQARLADTLRDAVTAGELPAKADVDAMAEALLALSEGAMLLSCVHDDPNTAGRLAVLALAITRAP
ncbi:MAG TPA: TetR/AcrR family transcriptional regulator [Myxococcota bacterium]|nr:TetR/AcrR family transcriptional regulator [Myxococcota bacterium]